MNDRQHLENIIKHAEQIREDTVALRRYIDNYRNQIDSQRQRRPMMRQVFSHTEMVMFYLQEVIRLCETPPAPPEYEHYL